MTEMLITEALDERDLLAKKIKDKIAKAHFVALKKNNEDTVTSGKKAEEFTEDAKSQYQSIMDLIARYYDIDRAIIKSNAATMITVLGKEMSVAEAISFRQKLDGSFSNALANKLTHEWEIAIQGKDEYERRLAQNAQNLRETISGKDSVKDETYKVVEDYIDKNKVVMVGIEDAKELADKIMESADENFSAINTAIKVSNATTYIEI